MKRKNEDKIEIERQRREATEWERQQRINPLLSPLLMPIDPSKMSREHSSDKIAKTSSTDRM